MSPLSGLSPFLPLPLICSLHPAGIWQNPDNGDNGDMTKEAPN